MPTYETLARFTADLHRLTPAQRQRFRRVVLDAFVPDLRTGRPFRPGLRIKGVRRTSGVYELTWSMGTGPAGRATFEYGTEVRPGTPHVIWRRIGTHEILTGP
ncbi:hypothetical protein I6J39_34135 (plasmid) [Streptomyces californicus]|uniref:Uncharacterized protein n=1 Tax=Streptomyces californicus TaxID=67351 RepID=A0ABX7JGA9_9ACTN|nr:MULTISPECIES: hypothetical protein [Streptomyces]QRV32414.1 hypothetical protein I6J39_34135 [Streptomyces californicus]QRV45830.1 hypothetical protein I6J41_34060 [Streptomyces californicus]